MKKTICTLLMCVSLSAIYAQEQTATAVPVNPVSRYIDKGCYSFLIDGKKMTLPCPWSELEQAGWRFRTSSDGEETVIPTRHIALLDDRRVPVWSPRKEKAELYFCNLSKQDATRKESMVFGIWFAPEDSLVTVYDFELPGGIRSGTSTAKNVKAIYGNAVRNVWDGAQLRLTYSSQKKENGFVVCTVAEDDNIEAPKGAVLGFGATLNEEIKRRIEQDSLLISDDEATEMASEWSLSFSITSIKEDLSQAISNSENPVKIAGLQYMLGSYCFMKKDTIQAIEYWMKAAEGGNSEAQYNVGLMNLNGMGMPQDYEKAITWYKKAIEQGDENAMNDLGYCYMEGFGVEKDEKTGFEWWVKAAESGYVTKCAVIGDAYRDGTYGMKKNDKEAVRWYQKGADGGDECAIYSLSYMYYSGRGVKKDYSKSFELMLRMDPSSFYVQQSLAEHYYYGLGTEKDVPQALIHYRNFLEYIDSSGTLPEEADQKDLQKEIETARKILKKHQQE